MEKTRNLAAYIVDLFEDLLCKKGIVVPCEDEDEETERYDENGELLANLYGMEYWNLVDAIESMLDNR